MAHTKQSRKRIRQSERRRLRNRSRMSRVRSAVKTLEQNVGRADTETLEKLYRAAASELDRAATRRIVHPNAAARKKSRLAKRIAGAKAAAGA